MIDRIGPLSYGRGLPEASVQKLPPESKAAPGDRFELSSSEPLPEKEWTILAYMCGSNDLKEQITGNIKEMEEVGSTDNAHLVAYVSRDDYSGPLDRIKNLFTQEDKSRVADSWKGSRVYHISQGDRNSREISSTLIQDRGREKVNDPSVLENFIKMGMEKFPAKHYMIILSGHGAGRHGALIDKDHKPMPLESIDRALSNAQKETGKKIDVLGFDACQMGQLEVAYQLKDSTNYMVASPGQTYGESFDFGPLMKGIKEAGDRGISISPRQMAWGMVQVSEGFGDDVPVYTALDLSRMPLIKESLDGFALALKKTDTPRETIRRLILQSPQHDESLYGKAKSLKQSGIEVSAENLFRPLPGQSVQNVDLIGLCRQIEKSDAIQDKELKKAATLLKETIEEAAVNRQSYFGSSDDLGLSVYLPTKPDGVQKPAEDYRNLSLSNDSLWNDFLNNRE